MSNLSLMNLHRHVQVELDIIIDDFVRDRPFNLKGGRGLWFFVSFIIFFSDNTRVRIFIYFVGQS
jgi:hypothetical protein